MHKLGQFVDCKGNVWTSDGEVLQSTNSATKQSVIRKRFAFIGREVRGRGLGGGYGLGFKHFGMTQDVCNVSLL